MARQAPRWPPVARLQQPDFPPRDSSTSEPHPRSIPPNSKQAVPPMAQSCGHPQQCAIA
eukprot:CAMPEP_0197531600 /NCGR_PEP_ID=MMETSP1318-20131121/36391_1 /TAXON_ID=552666 /ORGANISM="Partenskyella glossopodia, Strain RCC365" /LENGTH=58 /DNA_ID=CAMNT_0043087885 /DNA_START=419 /DNA_END=592 /DNA_ORIENTATION=+